jgi:prepilin-type N-terminal cleavage/methylation domain-containing protein
MLRNRKGVTLLEIMTVVVMAAIMMAITFPHMKDTRRASSMQSAKTQVESYLAVARAVAVRNGGRTYLIRSGNTLQIMADTGTGLVLVVRPVQLDSVSNVLLGATRDTVVYDSRGLATNLSATGERFYITAASGYGAGTKDSVCVTRLGLVLDRKCGLSVTPPEKEEVKDPDIIIIDDGPIIIGPPIEK